VCARALSSLASRIIIAANATHHQSTFASFLSVILFCHLTAPYGLPALSATHSDILSAKAEKKHRVKGSAMLDGPRSPVLHSPSTRGGKQKQQHDVSRQGSGDFDDEDKADSHNAHHPEPAVADKVEEDKPRFPGMGAVAAATSHTGAVAALHPLPSASRSSRGGVSALVGEEASQASH